MSSISSFSSNKCIATHALTHASRLRSNPKSGAERRPGARPLWLASNTMLQFRISDGNALCFALTEHSLTRDKFFDLEIEKQFEGSLYWRPQGLPHLVTVLSASWLTLLNRQKCCKSNTKR